VRRATLGWAALALAGLLIAAGAAYAASKITTQPIGLSSEPLSAGRQLAPSQDAAPKATATATPRRTATPTPRRTPTPTPTPTRTATAAPTVDDHGGGSGSDDSGSDDRGRGRGGGGDD
jgi:hypothetical protein